jgi:hypothetical protein
MSLFDDATKRLPLLSAPNALHLSRCRRVGSVRSPQSLGYPSLGKIDLAALLHRESLWA